MRRISILMAVLMVLLSVPVGFADSTTINVETVSELATEHNTSKEDTEDSLHNLEVQYQSLSQSVDGTVQLVDSIVRYKQLKAIEEAGSITPEEKGALNMISSMISTEDQDGSYEDMYTKYVKSVIVGEIDLKSNIDQLKNTISTIDYSVENGMIDLYKQAIELKQLIPLQQRYEAILKSEMELSKVSLEQGKISDYEYAIKVFNYEKQKLDNEKMLRSFDTLELNLKNNLGLPLDQTLVYQDELFIQASGEFLTLDAYIASGLENRVEVKNAKIAYDAAVEKETYARRYLTYAHEDFLRSTKEIIATKAAYDTAKEDVEINIRYAYADANNTYLSFKHQQESFEIAKKDFLKAQTSYEEGLISKATYDQADYKYSYDYYQYKQSARSFAISLRKLEQATNSGPRY